MIWVLFVFLFSLDLVFSVERSGTAASIRALGLILFLVNGS